uniref:Uncharacterized protein n=1 Tax=Arundo donax TaxID=35708 RepID=A0A0A9EJH0_ARUDO
MFPLFRNFTAFSPADPYMFIHQSHLLEHCRKNYHN